ncbi:hypothetical protein [Paraburkholderia sp. 40]|uniref:hypothetical protein n=1 Tax=unclassified Paraburkholderia TaxID=2615204 RepID=UPI003D242931
MHLLRLLRPALAAVSTRPVVLLKPPHLPSAHGLAYMGLPVDKVLQVTPKSTTDVLWSADDA